MWYINAEGLGDDLVGGNCGISMQSGRIVLQLGESCGISMQNGWVILLLGENFGISMQRVQVMM